MIIGIIVELCVVLLEYHDSVKIKTCYLYVPVNRAYNTVIILTGKTNSQFSCIPALHTKESAYQFEDNPMAIQHIQTHTETHSRT